MRSDFQTRVFAWLMCAFGPSSPSTTLEERGDRLAEEAIELLQSTGYPRERLEELVRHVYAKAPGTLFKEAGDVMVTLAALCHTAGVNLYEAAEAELERLSTPEAIARVRAKQAAKVEGSPIPGQL